MDHDDKPGGLHLLLLLLEDKAALQTPPQLLRRRQSSPSLGATGDIKMSAWPPPTCSAVAEQRSFGL